jgi:hypothetical protein
VAGASGGSDRVSVDLAFAALRRGDGSHLMAVTQLGASAVPEVGRYLDDDSVDIREGAMAVLAQVGTPNAVPLLARALADSSYDIRDRAAAALYLRFEPRVVASHPDVGTANRRCGRRPLNPARARTAAQGGPRNG